MAEEDVDYAKMIEAIQRIKITKPKITPSPGGRSSSKSIYNGIQYEYDGKKVKKQCYDDCWD